MSEGDKALGSATKLPRKGQRSNSLGSLPEVVAVANQRKPLPGGKLKARNKELEDQNKELIAQVVQAKAEWRVAKKHLRSQEKLIHEQQKQLTEQQDQIRAMKGELQRLAALVQGGPPPPCNHRALVAADQNR